MNKLHVYPNNNLSNKFAAKDISDGSLNQITTTGFYFGSNITEVTPYIKSHMWCLINAYVSGNSASIFVIAGNAMALSIYRNVDGIYSYYPIATKSDLEKQASFEPYVLNTNVSEYIKSLSAGKVHFFKTSSGTSGNPYTGGSCFYMVYIIDTSHNGIGLALNHSTTAYFMRISLGDVVYTKLSA